MLGSFAAPKPILHLNSHAYTGLLWILDSYCFSIFVKAEGAYREISEFLGCPILPAVDSHSTLILVSKVLLYWEPMSGASLVGDLLISNENILGFEGIGLVVNSI